MIATPFDRVSLPEAAAWIERNGTGHRPHTATLTRWINRGIRGRKLPAIRAGGGRYYVALADVAAFLDRVNEKPMPGETTPAIHAAAHELDMRQLDALLGKCPAAEQGAAT